MMKKGLSITRVGRRASNTRRFFVIHNFMRRKATKTTSHGNGSNAQYHLTGEEVGRLIAGAAGQRNKAIIRMFAETGIRRFELALLMIPDVRLDNRQIVIRSGKGSKSRVIPITEQLKRELRTLLEGQSTGPVFRSHSGGPLSLRQLNRIVALTGARAKIVNPNPRHRQITCHLFRHTFARLWKQRQASIETLSRILGHAHAATTWSLYGTESQLDVQRNYEAAIGHMFASNGGARPSSKTRKQRKGEIEE